MIHEPAWFDNIAPFDDFTPIDYLAEYYHSVFSENDLLLRFFAKATLVVPNGASILEYGGGPTVYQLISLASRASSIHFTDYLESNLEAVNCWVRAERDAHDWAPFVSTALQYEGHGTPGVDAIQLREDLLRSRLSSFGKVNSFAPSEDDLPALQFDVVSTNFVAESISTTRTQWLRAMSSICAYVADDGLLIMTAIRNASYWVSGGKKFPGHPIDRTALVDALDELGFGVLLVEEIDAEIQDPRSDLYEGYDGMIFTVSRRRIR